MQEKDVKVLLDKYGAGTASEEEIALLESWYLHFTEQEPPVMSAEERLATFDTVWKNLNPSKVKTLWPRIAAAASIVIACSFGAYFVLKNKAVKPVQQLAQNEPFVPGSKKAILILSSGKQISLTDAKSGTLAQEANATVTKTADGKVVEQADGAQGDAILYHTLITPRGGYYPLTMADGTIAIVDAGSSIKYPVNFKDGEERKVEITGQVYFEVKHNDKQPFKVSVKGQTIEDIGTRFNVNAYNDERAIRTTLVDGIVQVSQHNQVILNKAGQQAVNDSAHRKISIKTVNVDDAIAWKNGQTSFEGESVEQIMNQVSRWYDVDIVYDGNIKQRTFTGGVPRNAKFSDLVKALEFENIHVKLEGKELHVRP